MRGDSVRDLYAKTMALLGLGVLAGVGALVDYWPVGLTLPQAASVLEAPAAAAAFRNVPTDLVTSAAPSMTPLVRRDTVQSAHAVRIVNSLPVSEEPRVDVGQQVSLTTPSAFALAVKPEISKDVPVVTLATYQSAALTPDLGAFDDTILAPVDDEGDGVISGAFRKAKMSIVKTSVRTGASIFDAARVIGGAVRKALPN